MSSNALRSGKGFGSCSQISFEKSKPNSSKIDLMDNEENVINKIKKADFIEGDVNNGVMSLFRYLIFRVNSKIEIKRPDKFGGNVVFTNYDELAKEVLNKKIHPLDVKNSLSQEINKILFNFRNSQELLDLHKRAYPE